MIEGLKLPPEIGKEQDSQSKFTRCTVIYKKANPKQYVTINMFSYGSVKTFDRS